MRKGTLTTLAVAVVATLALAAPSGALGSNCKWAGKTPPQLNKKRAKEAITCLINVYRRSHGLPRLSYHRKLGHAAQGHSQSMDRANYYAHDGPDGSPADRARRAGYLAGSHSWGIGENIFWGFGSIGTPKYIVRGWMKSPSHRATILTRGYRNVGVGFAHGSPSGGREPNSGTYTADFGWH